MSRAQRDKGQRERWRPVPGYESHYEVSDLGRLRRTSAGRGTWPGRPLKATSVDTRGYPIVCLHINGRGTTKKVHRLVAIAFLGPCPDGMQVNHKDGDKRNPAVSNLEYVTQSENAIHALALGLYKPTGRPKFHGKLTRLDAAQIRRRVADGERRRDVAAVYGIHEMTVGEIVRGEILREVSYVQNAKG